MAVCSLWAKFDLLVASLVGGLMSGADPLISGSSHPIAVTGCTVCPGERPKGLIADLFLQESGQSGSKKSPSTHIMEYGKIRQ